MNVWSRRAFLAALLAQGMLPAAVSRMARAGELKSLYVNAFADAKGGMWVGGFTPQAELFFEVKLPSRGHAIAARPDHPEIAAVARRPDRYVIVIDMESWQEKAHVRAPEGRHFYGHGVYSPDGRYFFTPENDYDGVRGVIGVWDAATDYKRLGEYALSGIGPHELAFMPDGETLAVALGGIQTHPDKGRRKLNIPDMQPALLYVDAYSGQQRHSVRLPETYHKLSIRHMDVSAGGEVFVGMQNQGPAYEYPPLVARHKGDEGALTFLDAPMSVWQTMHNYIGSVTVDSHNAVVGAAAPRGDVVTFWQIRSGRLLSQVKLHDGCGLAAADDLGTFIATSGIGGIYHVDAFANRRTALREPRDETRRWDNHLLKLV